MDSKRDLVSVIVCHHQGDFITPCVWSILKSVKVDVQVIVATSQEHLVLPDSVRTLYIPGQPANKRNVASKFAHSNYIAFFDDDTTVDSLAIYEMLKVLKDEDTGMVFGKLKKMDNPRMFDEAGGFLTRTGFIWARGDRQLDEGQFDANDEIFAGKSAACMIKRNLMWRAGAFDPFMGILGEESDLAWRMWLSGFKVRFAYRSLTLHAFGTSLKPMDFYTHQRVYFNGARNYLIMLASNLEWYNLLTIVPVNFMAWTISAFGMLLNGKAQAGIHIFRGLWAFLTDLNYVQVKRRKVKDIRKVSDRKLFKTIMKQVGLSYYFRRLKTYWRIGLHG